MIYARIILVFQINITRLSHILIISRSKNVQLTYLESETFYKQITLLSYLKIACDVLLKNTHTIWESPRTIYIIFIVHGLFTRVTLTLNTVAKPTGMSPTLTHIFLFLF